MNQLAERLFKRDGAIWKFYSKTEIAELLEQVRAIDLSRPRAVQ
jgi:hypothetical protein